MKKELNKISFPQKRELSSIITKRVLEHKDFLSSTLVLIYYPLSSEVDTRSIIDAAFLSHKKVALPIIQDGDLIFQIISPNYEKSLQASTLGTMEPMEKPTVELESYTHTLLIVPGLAFSKEKDRLGRSKGFYDRFIQRSRRDLIVMGLCFDVQLFDTIVTDYWDQRVDWIITDKRVIG
jgi:5-formyltetrahydrofolate cyclo-ligase